MIFRPVRTFVVSASITAAKEINAGLVDAKTKARLADLGLTALAGSPADFGKLIAEETEKWSKVVKFSGAKPD
jgi:tripartite-type tricarboxylate transporter receptor subunit TctC